MRSSSEAVAHKRAKQAQSGLISRVIGALRRNQADSAPPKMNASLLGGPTMTGGYEAAQRNRRLYGFRPSEGSINSLNLFAGATLRSRARFLVRNNPYARKAQRVFVSNLIGTGIRPIPQPTNDGLKDDITQLWNDWVDEADADGVLNFYGLQELVGNALFEAGECFIRRRPRLARDGLSVPLQLQLLESEFCPYELNFVAQNGNVVRSGIEFNAIGQRTAYYFWKSHPGEYTLPLAQAGWTRVPAADVLHVFKPVRPGQIRGVSWLTTAIVTAYIQDQYEDAELQRKLTAALFAGFIYRPNNNADDPPIGQQDQPAIGTRDTSTDANQEVVAGLTPGMMQYLEEGEDVKFSEPNDVGPNFEAFMYRSLLRMCAGMDMPYSSVTGDFTKANYSSERARQLDMRAAIKQLQQTVNFQFNRPTYRWFFGDAVLAGALPIRASAYNASPRDFFRAKWVPPRMEWVDPMKDMQAANLAMRAGVTSREAVVLGLGETLEEVDSANARSNASADAHGLVYDSDPRRTNMRGSGNPPDAAAPAPETPAQTKDDQTDETVDDDEEEAAA